MSEVKWTEYQKQAIFASSCSIAVSAAAGSGKTAVLTNRIIEHIKSGTNLNSMLVVTFTKAAAQQLKDKISDALNKALYDKSLSDKEKQHIKKQLIALPNAKISTIDSFIIGLVRENFTEAGIPVGSGIMDEAVKSQIETDVAEQLIQDYYDGKITDEEYSIDDFDTFANVFGDPLTVSSLPGNLISLKDYYNTQPDPYKSILGDQEEQEFQNSLFGKTLFEYTKCSMAHYRGVFEKAVNAFQDAEIPSNAAVFTEMMDYCLGIIDVTDSNDNPYYKVKELLTNYKVGKVDRKNTPDNLQHFLGLKEEFRDFLKKNLLAGYYNYTLEEIDEAKIKIESQSKNLIAFLKAFESRLNKQKALRRMYSFNDYVRLGLKILTMPDLLTPSPLCVKLKSYYEEIYIDEYQDTDGLQDRIFSLLSRGDNLFTVGDIKQSIYGFRSAEPSIFDRQIRERPVYDPSAHESKTKIYLSDNFRSTHQIIDAVNCIFDNVLKSDPVISYGEADRLRCGNNTNGPKPEFHILYNEEMSCDDLREEELKYIAKRIVSEKKANPNLRYSDFAILSRTNETSSLAAVILNDYDVPSVDKNAFQFFNNPEIMLVMALFRCIDNPYSDIYLTAIMKSPIYGFTLNDQIRFRMAHPEKPLYIAVKNCADSNDRWSERCKKLVRDIEYYKPLARLLSCSEFVKEIYEGMMLTSIVSYSEGVEREEAARANLMQLYDYSRSFDSRKNSSLFDFLEYVDQLVKEKSKIDMTRFNSSDDAVQLATMHGSKGLQYKYVFLPWLSKAKREIGGDNFIGSRKLPLSFRPVENDERIENIFYKVSILSNKMSESDEMMRLLYVALTRPETTLIMTASQNDDEEKVTQLYDINNPDSEAVFNSRTMSYFSRLRYKTYLDVLTDGFANNPDLINFSIERVDRLEDEESVEECSDKPEEKPINEDDIKETLKERFNFVYPYRNLMIVPNKMSVSRMYPDLLDEEENGYTPEQLLIEEKEDRKHTEIYPHFISGDVDATPREQGISVHLFMQFFDIGNVYQNGIDAEMKRLLDEKYIYDETYKIIKYPWNRKKIANFFKSSLAMEMKNAKTIVRERKFTMNFPAESFTSDKEKAESLSGVPLLVQGVIDCMYVNDKDELILVDYKTDHFGKDTSREVIEETLKKRYNNQLMYYAYAADRLMHKKVDHIRLYSFAVDDIIELERKDIV